MFLDWSLLIDYYVIVHFITKRHFIFIFSLIRTPILLIYFHYFRNRITLIPNLFHWYRYSIKCENFFDFKREQHTVRIFNFHRYNPAQWCEIINDKSISTYLPAAEVLRQSFLQVQAVSSVKHYSNILLNYVFPLGGGVVEDMEDGDWRRRETQLDSSGESRSFSWRIQDSALDSIPFRFLGADTRVFALD